MSVNIVVIQGKLGGDPELKKTPTGHTICTFSLALSEKYKDKAGNKQERVTWVRVIAWANLAEICGKYLVKGQACVITGKLQSSSWEKDGQKHTTLEVVASDMSFSGPAPSKKEIDEPPF